MICHSLKPFKKKKNRKLKYYEQVETIKVPVEVKFKRKDGTILTLKAKKIVRKTPSSRGKS